MKLAISPQSQEIVSKTAVTPKAVLLTISWLWGEIASFMKLRLHLPLPDTKA